MIMYYSAWKLVSWDKYWNALKLIHKYLIFDSTAHCIYLFANIWFMNLVASNTFWDDYWKLFWIFSWHILYFDFCTNFTSNFIKKIKLKLFILFELIDSDEIFIIKNVDRINQINNFMFCVCIFFSSENLWKKIQFVRHSICYWFIFIAVCLFIEIDAFF